MSQIIRNSERPEIDCAGSQLLASFTPAERFREIDPAWSGSVYRSRRGSTWKVMTALGDSATHHVGHFLKAGAGHLLEDAQRGGHGRGRK
jgi:hypothetical protein